MSGEDDFVNFHQMELDDRILKAISLAGWSKPTLIQEKAIPLLLEGKDVILRARTGSGKTAAFAIPLVQRILSSKSNAEEQITSAFVLTPSKELAQQTKQAISQLISFCGKLIKVVDLSSNDTAAQKHVLSERPDIVISTPGRIVHHLQSGNVDLKNMEVLVIDEADLIFSYGFEKDFKKIVEFLPAIYQAMLVSATITEDVVEMKKIVLHNPVILKLEEPDLVPESQLSHQRILAEADEKPAILSALFKLHLLRGKNVIFVNTVDRCYKLKLFLEQFAVKSCVLNSELPTSIRCHVINQFNQGKYDIIIASDEKMLDDAAGTSSKKDKESGASRGIDFQCVSNVLNFDFPLDVSSYIHRAGRTARGTNKGSVLSFVSIKDQAMNDKVEERLKAGYSSDESIIRNYQFRMEEVEAFRYRAHDAWRAITKVAVHEARIKEIKQEIFNSEKLKGFFSDHTRELEVLRHDKPLKTVKIQQHLSTVPDYIVPNSLKRIASSTNKRTRSTQSKKYSLAKAAFESQLNNPLSCKRKK